ncbi:transglycosylase SLT domain-containing protein [Minwuia sp.]|uniref:transglycosylase SLT domain-containing protein n=1 Tax=Minwuia sp. TaxID=2493630 RepID=UPI003A957C49
MKFLPTLAALILLALPAAANTIPTDDKASQARACRDATAQTEQRYRIPAGLLGAIALVESGRSIKGVSARTAWPWTIHSQGTGRWLDTRDEAIAMVQDLKSQGVKNIDVGCMQVNLMHHPDAFKDMKSAFTPAVNADYAGKFLSELFQETRSWTRAAAFYHSRTPERGNNYRKLVLAAWNGQATAIRRAVRNEVRARTGRNVSVSGKLRRLGSSVYIQTGRNAIRIRKY